MPVPCHYCSPRGSVCAMLICNHACAHMDRIYCEKYEAVRCDCVDIQGIDSEELINRYEIMKSRRCPTTRMPFPCLHYSLRGTVSAMLICNHACVHMDNICCNNDEAVPSGCVDIKGIDSEELTTVVKLLNRGNV